MQFTQHDSNSQQQSNGILHQSVLLEEFLNIYRGVSLRTFIDGTLGAGGHSFALLREHPEIELLIGIDQDEEALSIAADRLKEFKHKIVFYKGNFSSLDKALKQADLETVDGIFLDLGVSSMQLDRPEKGFSFLRDGPLDMRMDKTDSLLTAYDIVNHWPEAKLTSLFYEYGEEPRSKLAAHLIVQARKDKPIETTKELASLLKPLWNKHRNIHPATLVFQALRIEVNQELEVLKVALPKACNAAASGARIGVISFHSLEDRIVKHFFKSYEHHPKRKLNPGEQEPPFKLKVINKKPIVASEEEIIQNPRSRSAKMRFVEKI